MPYQARTERRATSTGLDGTVWVLEDGVGGRAEVWPAFGFNCYRWLAPCQGRPLEMLYTDPQLFQGSSPTRSGIPVLFPFPNRIREGKFRWQGKDYQLPPNDPSGKNAIHGWACRRPWRVVEHGTNDQEAWLTGEFHAAVDAPDVRALWPADYRLRVTYRLRPDRLRIEADLANPDGVPLPFGLGYHPYFSLPEPASPDYLFQTTANQYWELKDSLPTGTSRPVDGGRNFFRPQPCRGLELDDVLTGMDATTLMPPEHLCRRALLQEQGGNNVLRLFTSPEFQELVVFTPPHGRAIAIEPYTCVTDAINLQQRGIEAGLLVLPPGGTWAGVVELAAG